MATVLNIPRDERFGELGKGFGNVLQGFLDEKDESEKAAANQEIISSLILELGLEGTAPDLAAALSSREAELDILTQLQLLGAVKQQTDKRRIEEGVRGVSESITSGEMSIEEGALAALEFLPGDFPSVLGSLGDAENRRLRASEGALDREQRASDAAVDRILRGAGLDIQADQLAAQIEENELRRGFTSEESAKDRGAAALEGAANRDLRASEGAAGRATTERGQDIQGDLGARARTLDETIFNRDVAKEEEFGNSASELLQRFNEGEIGVDEFALGIVGADPSTAGQIVPAVVASNRPSTQPTQNVTFSRPLPDGNIRTRTVKLPVGVDPADTEVGANLIRQGFTVGKDTASPGARPTQFEQRLETAARLRGENPNDPEVRDRMVNLEANRQAATKQLDEVFKASTEGFTREFETQRNRVTYGIAAEMVEDNLVNGDPLAAAVNNAIIEANTEFYRGTWIPEDTQMQLREEVPGDTAQSDVKSSVNLGLWLMNSQGFDDFEVQAYLERSEGPAKDRTIGSPNLTQQQIFSIMTQIRQAVTDAQTGGLPAQPVEQRGFIQELFNPGGGQ